MNKQNVKRIMIAVIVIIAVYVAVHTISICLYSKVDEACKSDVAIVLGAATYNGKVSPVYQERMNHGIWLYQEGYVDKIIVTGGLGEGEEITEAEAAKQYAIEQGVPVEDILLEDTSTITQENLENSKVIMETNALETAIVVSDPLHMKRAMLLAEDAGIVAYSSPTPTTRYVSLKTQIPFLAREVFFYIGYRWYRLFVR